MRKALAVALLRAAGLAITAAPAVALQVVVTHVDKNTDGSMTYHFAVKMDPGEALTPGESKATADFVTSRISTASLTGQRNRRWAGSSRPRSSAAPPH